MIGSHVIQLHMVGMKSLPGAGIPIVTRRGTPVETSRRGRPLAADLLDDMRCARLPEIEASGAIGS